MRFHGATIFDLLFFATIVLVGTFITFSIVFGWPVPTADGAELPLKILPDQVETITDLKISVIKPGRWSCNPFKNHAMKKRGEKPEPRLGPTIQLKIEAISKIKGK